MRYVQKAMIYLGCVGILTFGLAYGQSDTEIAYSGKVLDSHGKPVAGAQACLYEMTSAGVASTYDIQVHRVVTSTDGQFRLTALPRGDIYRYGRIIVTRKGLATHWVGWDFQSDKQDTIVLGEPSSLQGRVTDTNGRPLDQAKVTFALVSRGEATSNNGFNDDVASRALMTQTDVAGKFHFPDLPGDATFELLVSKPGYATVSTLDWSSYNYRDKLKYRTGQPDIRIQLPLEATITGITVDKASGRPVPGMEMVLFGNTHRQAWGQNPFKSDRSGRFVLSGLAAGKYRLELASCDRPTEPMPWVARSLAIELASGEALKQTRFELEKGSMLEVLVTDSADGKPVEKARVNLFSPETDLRFYGLTDDTGLARIRLLPGGYELRSPSRAGYAYHYDDKKNVVISEGLTQRIQWPLTAQPKIVGVVRDPNGVALGGVDIQICPAGRNAVQSKSDGTYEIAWNESGWPREDTVFYIVARDKGNDLGLALPVSKDSTPLDLALKPAVTLVGRVVDASGKGIANASLRTMLRASNWGASLGDYQNLPTTDANGLYEIRSLPPDNRYALTAMAQGYGETDVDLDAHEAVAGRVEVGVMTLVTANLNISGQVVDTEGHPVAGARVNAQGEGQPDVRATSDAQGQFVLKGLCEGAVYVRVDAMGQKRLSSRATVEAGASNIRLTVDEGRPANRHIRTKSNAEILATGQFVAGRVVDESDQPVGGVPVNVQAIRRERDNGKFSWTYSNYNTLGDVTDDQGRFIIAVEEDAAYCLLFSPRQQAAIIQYDVPMKTEDLQVTLPKGGTVNGRLVQIQNGQKVPIPNVEVKIEQTDRASYSHLGFDRDRTARTDESGRFSFKHLRTLYRADRYEGTNDVRVWEVSYGDLKQTLGFYDHAKILDIELVIRPKLEDAARLKGKALPDWKTLGLTIKSELIDKKPLLVCFLNYEQRLDRRSMSRIARSQTLTEKGLSVIAIDLSGSDQGTLKSWADDLSLPSVTQITGDKDAARFRWNVQSLPWLILTDVDHVVTGEGLSVEEVTGKP